MATINYKGHEIRVVRDEAMGGWEALFCSVVRTEDGFLGDEFSYTGDETVWEMINILKNRVDNELASEDPWGEKELRK